jgi:hypothetical protein
VLRALFGYAAADEMLPRTPCGGAKLRLFKFDAVSLLGS